MSTEEENQEPLVFDLDFKEVPVTIKGEAWKLVEISGSQRDEYMNDMNSRMRYNAEGKPAGLKSLGGMQTKLLTMALRDPEGKRPNAQVIDSWPSRVSNKLFEEAQKLNGIEKEKQATEEDLKND